MDRYPDADPEPVRLTQCSLLNDIEPQPIRWLSPGRLAAGKLTILEGPPGAGKSTLLCDWAARVSRGEALPGAASAPPDEPGYVLFIAGDGGLADVIRPRLEAAGADLTHTAAILCGPDRAPHALSPTIPHDLDAIQNIIQHLEAALVIIDPLSALLTKPGKHPTPLHDHALEPTCASLATIAARTRAAIVITRHPAKHPPPSVHCALLLAPDPDDPSARILASTKGNLAAPPPSLAFHLEPAPDAGVTRIVLSGQSPRTATELIHPPSPERQTDRAAAKAWLHEILAPGPLAARKVEDMAKRAGFTPRTLRRAREDIGVISRRNGPRAGGSYLWSLPPAAAPNPPQVDHLANLANLANQLGNSAE